MPIWHKLGVTEVTSIQAKFSKSGWTNWSSVLAKLNAQLVKDERAALVVKMGARGATDPQLQTAAQICHVARRDDFRELVYVPGTEQGMTDVRVLTEIVPLGNPRLTSSVDGRKLTFTAPDNTPQPRKRRTVPKPRVAPTSQGCD